MWTASEILYSPQVIASTKGRFQFSATLDDIRFKTYLLYFPKMIYVPQRFYLGGIGINLTTDLVSAAIAQGVVEVIAPRQVEVPQLNIAFFQDELRNILIKINGDIPDRLFVSSLETRSEMAGQPNALYATILNILPAVAPDTTLADILNFKDENSKLLQRLASHFDRLGLEIGAIADGTNYREGLIDSVLYDLREDSKRIEDLLKKSGSFLGRIDLSFSALASGGVLALTQAALIAFFGLPGLVSQSLIKGITFEKKRVPVVPKNNWFPKVFEYVVDASKIGLLSKVDVNHIDDWVYHRLDDRNNSVVFSLPEAGEKVNLMDTDGTFANNAQILT